MKNQYSFRLTTTLLPTDTSAKVTQVINKVDANGDKFYPTFTEETVVITNDDRTIMETTRAVCTDGSITFTKRWLPDDGSLEPVDNRKLTWNPWSLLFITLWASDIIDRDDDMVWQWDQTYLWKAEYKWRLVTEKGVEYPHFDTLADLQAYWTPFGWMFAVVDASWELYRYNDVTEEWGVVTTNEPTNPEQASTSAIGTVRVATQAEFNAGTEKWENDEYLVATIPQIKANIPENNLHIQSIWTQTDSISFWQSKSISFEVTKPGFITLFYYYYYDSSLQSNANRITASWTATPTPVNWDFPNVNGAMYRTYAVWVWTATFTGSWRDNTSVTWQSFRVEMETYFYFW